LVLLNSRNYQANLHLTLELIKKAVQEDENGNYEDAFEKYVAGLESFKKHLKSEKREDVKQVIRMKVRPGASLWCLHASSLLNTWNVLNT